MFRTGFRMVTLIAGVTAFALITGCAPKARKAGGYMDDPLTHYKQGMKYWDEAKYDQAAEEFNLSKSLDPKYPLAYAGLALTTAQKATAAADKKETEKGFKEAIELADKAQSFGANKLAQPYVAKAIVITMKNEGAPVKEWLKSVENEYEKALKIDPANSESYFRRGVTYKKAFEFGKASNDFRKVLDLKKDFTAQANSEWELVQKIERAAPGTDVGKKIALVDKISRADIAALFISELKIDKLVDKRRPKEYDNSFQAPEDSREFQADKVVAAPVMTDINDHWAKNFITDIVNLNIRGLEPYPDHTFHPNDLVNRAEFAMFVEDALIAILGDQSLASKYVGSTSRFPDVNSSHPAYNAICNAVDKGVMDAELNGEFGLDKTVSGPDALLIIRRLKDLNKIE